MLNIVVPLAGSSFFFDKEKDGFIKPFVEICGKTMLELFIDNFSCIQEKQFIFIVKEEDNTSFHLDEAIRVLTHNKAHIITIKNETAGMVCTAMLAVDFIDNEMPLIITNMDQVFEFNLQDRLRAFDACDAGVFSFESIHPRFAYVKCDSNNFVLQAFEKKPMSKNAIAGLYYFKYGSLFMRAAKNAIRKDMHYQGKYFVALLLNELILENKKVLNVDIDKGAYHTFYSPTKIHEYERIKNV